MKGLDIIYKIDPNVRIVFIPVIFVTAISILIVFTINFGYSQINEKIDKLGIEQQEEQKLSTKLEILRSVQEDILSYSNASLVAVPNQNPTTWSLSTIRALIIENSLGVEKAQAIVRNAGDELSSVTINLELSGSLNNLLTFIESTREMAPIIKTSSVESNLEQDGHIANIELLTYWAGLPKKVPAIDEPITGLDNDEIAILVDIKNLLRPEFNVLEAQPPSDKLVPFRTNEE